MLKPITRFKLDTLIQRQLSGSEKSEIDSGSNQKILQAKLWKLNLISKHIEKFKRPPVLKA